MIFKHQSPRSPAGGQLRAEFDVKFAQLFALK
jgi:hypothetical protein